MKEFESLIKNIKNKEYQSTDPRNTTSIEDFEDLNNFKRDNPNYDKI